jgi:glutathione synthase/RimK-type ligase-like ATP-grasp enzyme
MILVCGGLADSVTELVCARLEHLRYEYRLLDLGRYPEGYRVRWRWGGGPPEGWIEGPGWRVGLEALTGVFVRYLGPEGRLPPPDLPADLSGAMYAEYDVALSALFEDLPCAVVNRIAGAMSNHSKPLQALLVREAGLLPPETLVTSDPAAARAFYEACGGEVVYKSLSGIRSIVRRVGPEQLARLPLLRHGPAQFQRFVPGTNVRVHTVGDEDLFATEIRSEAVDYRYARRDGLEVEMRATRLPLEVEAACFALTRRLGIVMAGIDLKVTPDGRYHCFEINPSPGFVYYEQHTGQPISEAVAELLRSGRSGPLPAPAEPRPAVAASAPAR